MNSGCCKVGCSGCVRTSIHLYYASAAAVATSIDSIAARCWPVSHRSAQLSSLPHKGQSASQTIGLLIDGCFVPIHSQPPAGLHHLSPVAHALSCSSAGHFQRRLTVSHSARHLSLERPRPSASHGLVHVEHVQVGPRTANATLVSRSPSLTAVLYCAVPCGAVLVY